MGTEGRRGSVMWGLMDSEHSSHVKGDGHLFFFFGREQPISWVKDKL